MKYVCISHNNDKYLIELDEENTALREIILHEKTSSFEISCFEDCLAEEKVDISQIEGEITNLSKKAFEDLWQTTTAQYSSKWYEIKKSMTIGTIIEMQQCYIYPQGIILKQNSLTGICEKTDGFILHRNATVRIIGYDDLNMWLIVEKV